MASPKATGKTLVWTKVCGPEALIVLWSRHCIGSPPPVSRNVTKWVIGNPPSQAQMCRLPPAHEIS
jgi:hypothetical protein